MKKTVLFAILAISVPYVYAQEFKEGLLYDLTGHVKEMKLSTKNSLIDKKNVKFQKDGRCKRTLTFFNENGLPLGWSVFNGDKGTSFDISYDYTQIIESTVLKNTIGGNQCQETFYTYTTLPTGHTIVCEARYVFTTDKAKSETHCVYDDYTFDEVGNWIKRHVSETKKFEGHEETSTNNYIETRLITYYE